MARDMLNENDFGDVTLPSNAGKSREVDAGHPHDPKAQHKGAVQLAYSMHAGKCDRCASAESEGHLCGIGQQIYAEMRKAGIVE